jgi:hypothetical protein
MFFDVGDVARRFIGEVPNKLNLRHSSVDLYYNVPAVRQGRAVRQDASD